MGDRGVTMADLTPEALAAWRKEAEESIRPGDWPGYGSGPRIIALLDAHAAEKAAREEAERKCQRERSMKGQWRKKVRDLETALSEQRALIPKITETAEDSRTPAPEGYSAGHWYQVARKWERYARGWERIALAHKAAREKADRMCATANTIAAANANASAAVVDRAVASEARVAELRAVVAALRDGITHLLATPIRFTKDRSVVQREYVVADDLRDLLARAEGQ